jgi:signal peptidase I
MAPALRDGDVLLVRRTGRTGRSGLVRPGDVVLVRWAARPGQLSVKRATDEPGYVLGDNVFGSTDSRELGPAIVLGVARWRLWPRPGRLTSSKKPEK